MQIRCPHCKKEINLRQKYAYHAGFSNQGFLYCGTCTAILEFGTYNPSYVRLVGDKHPWMLTPEEKRKVEEDLRACACGGRFRFDAYPRCPFCSGDISSLLPDSLHFLEIGVLVDADKDGSAWMSNKEEKPE